MVGLLGLIKKRQFSPLRDEAVKKSNQGDIYEKTRFGVFS